MLYVYFHWNICLYVPVNSHQSQCSAVSSKYPPLFTLQLTNGAVLTRPLTLTIPLHASICVYAALFYKEKRSGRLMLYNVTIWAQGHNITS